ncbi:hypothetical protein VP01_53g3 [Puccinia sorghi]|uniref:Borealin N-terminal domain-containing protein n=1 Tax=Puccinia sorghi TaxID=27349 RepID=A0A0L6ULV7_9BASI|nr:hypothetical protein VP01_53g3 [Puccinia sorghi]
MANQKPKTHRHNETVKQLPPAEQPSQGISGKLFGLFKKFPMQLTSPSKEVLPQDDSQSEQERSNSEQDQEEEEDDEDEDEDDEDEDKDESEQEIVTESEQEDPLGDEQCKAIMENYLLETSTRTNLLRNRIQTHFRPALRRRLEFELSRITPSIANVTALDYHQRDQGILRHTMEHVARLALEQKTSSIGIKRSQSQQDQIWDEKEKSHHRKRKRQLTNNSASVSSKTNKLAADAHDPCPPSGTSANNAAGRPPSRSKPPTSRSTQGGQSRKQSNGSIESTDLNPRLPSTPQMSEFKPVRVARRNESLLSVNGSPVISYAPEETLHHPLPPSASNGTLASSQFTELFPPSTSSSSLPDHHHHLLPLHRSLSSNSAVLGGRMNSEFTFVEKSKWKDLELQLLSLQLDQSQKKKIDDLLKGCLSFGDN